MSHSNLSTYSETTVMLTIEGRLALAADALAAAQKTDKEGRQKRLCEQAMRYLRPVVQGSSVQG